MKNVTQSGLFIRISLLLVSIIMFLAILWGAPGLWAVFELSSTEWYLWPYVITTIISGIAFIGCTLGAAIRLCEYVDPYC